MAIRVLQVITSLGTGGAEMMLLKLLTQLHGSEFAFRVVCLKGLGSIGPRIQELGMPVLALGERGSLARRLSSTVRYVREFEPDVIHSWMYHANVAAHLIRVGIASGVPAIVSIRGALHAPSTEKPLLRAVRRIDARLSRFATRVLYNSSAVARQHERLGYDESKTLVIPNGFDVTSFAPDPAAGARFRAMHGIDPDEPLVGVVARYHPVKGHAVFAEAAARVLETFPSCRFALAGRGCEWTNPPLARLLRELGLEGRTVLLGDLPDPRPLYNALTVLVSPSLSESFPNAVGEALACGVPCVVTDVGDCAALVGDAGTVVPPRDAIALAEGIIGMLRWPAQAWQNAGERGRERIVREYSLARIGELYGALYRSVVERTVGAAV